MWDRTMDRKFDTHTPTYTYGLLKQEIIQVWKLEVVDGVSFK